LPPPRCPPSIARSTVSRPRHGPIPDPRPPRPTPLRSSLLRPGLCAPTPIQTSHRPGTRCPRSGSDPDPTRDTLPTVRIRSGSDPGQRCPRSGSDRNPTSPPCPRSGSDPKLTHPPVPTPITPQGRPPCARKSELAGDFRPGSALAGTGRTVLNATVTAGQASDVACFAPVSDRVRVCRGRGQDRAALDSGHGRAGAPHPELR